MSRFKRCELGDCAGVVSKSKPKIVTFSSLDEAFGNVHGKDKHGPQTCKCCGAADYTWRAKPIKLKVCNPCYESLINRSIDGVEIDGMIREIQSFDQRKNIVYHTLLESLKDKTLVY